MRQRYILSKAIISSIVVISITITCLLVMRQTIYRRHELYFGSQTERGKPDIDVNLSTNDYRIGIRLINKEKCTSVTPDGTDLYPCPVS